MTNGFFEQRTVQGLRHKEKHLFNQSGASQLFLAGFFKCYDDADTPVSEHFTILTTSANDSMVPYHDRMPILIHKDEIAAWLSGAAREEILRRAPFAVEVTPSMTP